METTRKLDMEDVLVLKELQMYLLRRGIKTTQKTLLSEMIEFITDKKTEFVNFFAKKEEEQTEDSFHAFLKMKCVGKERTNAVLEHDLIV